MNTLNELSKKLSPFAMTVLRLVVGLIFVVHGWLKLTHYEDWVSQLESLGVPTFMAPVAIAGELGGGAGLLLGALTPIAAFGVLCTMVVAIFTVHIDHGLLARDGGFEYPLTMACVALYFVVHGAGPLSVDHLVFAKLLGRGAEEDEGERGERVRPPGRPHEAHP